MMVKTSTHTPTHTRGSSCDARWCANDLALGWRNRKSGCVRRLLRWIDSSSCKKKTHKKIKTCPFRYDSYLPPPSSDPDENTFRRRSRPAIPETFSSEPVSFITLSALNSFFYLISESKCFIPRQNILHLKKWDLLWQNDFWHERGKSTLLPPS